MSTSPCLSVFYVNDKFGNPLGKSIDERPTLSPYDPEYPDMCGRHCYLERLHSSHTDNLYEAYLLDNDSIWTYLPWGPYESKEEFAAACNSIMANPKYCMYTIISNISRRPVGNCAYLNINIACKSIEVGSLIFSRYMKRSAISTEAMYMMMDAAFKSGFRRYEWKCNALNRPSISAAQRYGFSFEGLFRNFMVVRGCNRDTAWFSIIDEDWPNIKSAFEQWFDVSNFDTDGNQKVSLSQLTRPYVVAHFPSLNVVVTQL